MIWSIQTITGVQSQLFGLAVLCSSAATLLFAYRLKQDVWKASFALVVVLAAGLFAGRVGAVANALVPGGAFFDPAVAGITSSGAAVGAALMCLAVVRFLGRGILASVAPALWILLALGRLGCVFQGCDFGRVASFGIAYPKGSSAFILQAHHHLIETTALWSRPTLPFAGLDVVAALIAMAIALRDEGQGRLALASAMFYVGVRFLIEFSREPLTTVWFGPFSRPQWLCVCLLVPMVLLHRRWSSSWERT